MAPAPKFEMSSYSSDSESESDGSTLSFSDGKASDGNGTRDFTDDLPIPLKADFKKHLTLLGNKMNTSDHNAINSAPLFTGSIWREIQPSPSHTGTPRATVQYGLLGGSVDMLGAGRSTTADPRVFHSVTAPSSTFICGSQGSGKSHTLSCLLENCFVPSTASVLPKPLTGVVFHYDTFSSDAGGSPCEAAFLSSASPKVHVRVLCAPTNIRTIKKIYRHLPNVSVEELLIKESDLNTKRMLDLMAAGGKEMPLYLHVLNRVLRDMRMEQQRTGLRFSYDMFKGKMAATGLAPAQSGPLQQRLDTLESFLFRQAKPAVAGQKNKPKPGGTDWTTKAGQLTIVDLSCPCVTPEMACSLFGICLSLFLEQGNHVGRVVALDEAHKYMTESTESMALTNSLMETIRLQRHLGTRVMISTQEPSISPKLLDLCSVTIVHRFSSPEWLRTLHQHLAGVSSASRILKEASSEAKGLRDVATICIDTTDPLAHLFSVIVNLQVGEALVFAPSAAVGLTSTAEGNVMSDGITRLGSGIMKLRIRARVTTDGGRSVLAN